MKRCVLLILIIVTPFTASPVLAQKIVKESTLSKGKERSYYVFAPDKITPATPAPLIILLHGSGRNGLSLAEKWKEIAKKEKLIIAGPDSINSQQWKIPEDGPDFIQQLVETLKAKYPIDTRRVYLFGHSAGAGHALYLSLLESEYFAATAVHAGAVGPGAIPFMERAQRKIPIAIFVGTNDELVPLPLVRADRDALHARGFKVELAEIKGHTHWYYDRAAEINRSAWEFFKAHELASEPKYQQHRFSR